MTLYFSKAPRINLLPLLSLCSSGHYGIWFTGLPLRSQLQPGQVFLRRLGHLLRRGVSDRMGLHAGHRRCHAHPLLALFRQVRPQGAAVTHPTAHSFIRPPPTILNLLSRHKSLLNDQRFEVGVSASFAVVGNNDVMKMMLLWRRTQDPSSLLFSLVLFLVSFLTQSTCLVKHLFTCIMLSFPSF